ncbi:aminoglycoside phosphotransferase [Carbonactinospora thermoautotrophica]|uniref:phosphotransferase n=1 Tax=Carbonactinospora thermoautotrophica TaxID=1469144 RepID=UPI00226EDF2F|nr:phosphotransferase [Carbonactinospora thermoautotrophica]MCX9190151.1 aminoglycoside phosphotransferase [Carbonactinospora thermoautotrophica]
MTEAAGCKLGWGQLPRPVREAIEQRLGARIVEAVTQAGGFTPGLAARLRLADGAWVFVKGIPADHPLTAVYQAEARIGKVLPAGVPASRLLFSVEQAGWVVLAFCDVPGRAPDLSPGSGDLPAVLAAAAQLEEMLTPCPLPDASTVEADLGPLLQGWRQLAARPPADLDPWCRRHLDRLAAHETGWASTSGGDTLVHADLRADNLLRDAAGRVWVVDWSWPSRGAAWLDIAFLVPQLILAGHTPAEAEDLARRVPAWRRADPEAVTAFAVAAAGYWTRSSREPEPAGVVGLRAYQARAARAGIAWAAHRTGWR